MNWCNTPSSRGAACLAALALAWIWPGTVAAAPPPLTAAALSPNGQEVVVGSQAGIQVLSWPALQRKRELACAMPHVHDLAFSPRGDRLAAAGGEPAQHGQMLYFAWPSGKLQRSQRLHDDLIYALAWHGDGKRVAAASGDRQVSLLNPSNDSVRTISGHSHSVLAVAFLPGDQFLVSAGRDQSLRMWELATGKLRRTLDNHTAAVRDLALRPAHGGGLPMIASAGADHTVRLWQPTIGRLVRFARLSSAPLAIAWTPDGERLLASCADGHLRVIDADTVEVLADIPVVDGWAYTVVAADSRHALVGGSNGQLKTVPLDTTR